MALVSSLCIAAPERSGTPACFGRFLVDVPAGATVAGVSTDYLFGFLKLERTVMDAKRFAQFSVEREELYRGKDRKSLSEFLCVRHTMSARSLYAKQEATGSEAAHHSEGTD